MAQKNYYWLRLKKDYFNTPRIKKLRKIAGGDTYTIIYLKMQLLSIDNGGCLFYEGIEPTFEEELALKLDEDIENVKITLAYLNAQQMIEQNNNEYSITEAKNNIGKECESAERVRQFREKQRQKALHCNAGVTNGNTEIELEKELEIELELEKDIESDKEKINKKEIKHKYGTYGRVLLTDTQLKKLKADYGEEFITQAIDRLDEYIQSNNNKNHYTDFNLVLRKAIREKWSILTDLKGCVIIEDGKNRKGGLLEHLKSKYNI